MQIVVADRLTYDAVRDELHAHLSQSVDLHLHDAIRQTELGNAVLQHTADLVKRLKDGHVIAALGHVASKRQPRWARSDDGDLNALRWRTLRDSYLSTLALIVGSEALQVTDGHGRLLHLHMHAATLALLLLRTDAATDGWQCACFFQYAGSLEEVATLDVLNERGDLYAHRATLHAGRRHAVEATLRLT